ncbi:hypothetical protein FZZ93_05645 [Halomonas eurihalina]|uniref:Uncharacterized protein n=1 Tax=Halomonas eurihalina TaxID=42566 RepID=A0A5D9DBN4_HALER|nr:hypothetical protein [Halomonas eurihalina]MDR5859433.1 hypothetical protein [Halomonas eurihalina]TZG40530.1 hypothetical protein FZZ93_05645 [Halomonas eurihalina]
MSTDRNDLEFRVYVSFCVEKVTETLNARAERFCTFLLILLGSAVFAEMSNTFVLGVAVAAIAAVQFVCRFGEAAGAAKAQKHRYSGLLGSMSRLGDDELQSRIDRIEELDTRSPSFIDVIAYNKACYMCEKEDGMRPLPTFAWLMAFLVGGHPCGHRVRKESRSSAH